MPVIDANGITLCYEDTGTGDPLLLIMGLGGQLTDWSDEFVDTLARRNFRVIRHDNRDSGLSTEFDWEPPPRRALAAATVRPIHLDVGYTLSDMASDASGLLQSLGIDRAHVMGVSMGGMIAQTMAIEKPQAVASLTSIMSNTGDRRHGRASARILPKIMRAPIPSRPMAAEVATEMYALWAGSSWDRARHLESAKRSVERSYRPQGMRRQSAAVLASPDRTAALASVRAPTLVIHGLEDKLVLPSGGIATTEAIPRSRLMMFPDMGHDLPVNRHEEIADAIRANADRAG